MENKSINLTPQNNDDSFLSRLFTEINGLINWDWKVDDIEKICTCI